MAETVLIDCIWIDGNDFAGESNEVSFAPEVDTPENTTSSPTAGESLPRAA